MLNRTILAIDPGDIQSGYVLMELPDIKLIEFGKIDNNELLRIINRILLQDTTDTHDDCNIGIAIEMIGSYGMGVGKSVFETCVWIGRYIQVIEEYGYHPVKIYRMEEKVNLCHSSRAKDSNIRLALIDRFAKFDTKNGKGTKAHPDVFYGVSKDVWAAIAVAVTYHDEYIMKEVEKDGIV